MYNDPRSDLAEAFCSSVTTELTDAKAYVFNEDFGCALCQVCENHAEDDAYILFWSAMKRGLSRKGRDKGKGRAGGGGL